jgi:uncharacterized membrane protein YqjE
MLLILNVLGLMIGPAATGFVSDMLRASQGDESLRYALLITTVLMLPIAAACYWQAGRSIDADLLRARERD